MTDIDRARLSRYIDGCCTALEQEQVERWLAESPAHRAVFEAFREAAALETRTVSEERTAELWASLLKKIGEAAEARPAGESTSGTGGGSTRSSFPFRRQLPLAMKIAGLMLGGSVAGYLILHRPSTPVVTAEPTIRTITTAYGQRLGLRLPDSTLVVLAPASTLRLSSAYGARDRVVHLEGEAAFTVTHDSTRPFIVRAGDLTATDLGTRFVVRAYAQDSVSDVVVAEGRVAVTHDSATTRRAPDSLLLSRGQRARATPAGRLAFTRDVPLDSYFGWTEGRLVFTDTPVREAVAQLERWRDVEIRLASPELGARKFTTSFSERESTPQILHVMATVLGLEVEQAGPGRYTLRARP